MRVLVLVLSFLCSSLCGQSDYQDLELKIERHLRDGVFRSSNVSISVVDVETNELIVGHRPHKVLTPASSLKLLTTYTGLMKLGTAFTFNTDIYHTGRIEKDGTLKGDIVIKGSGDPTLGSPKIDEVLNFKALISEIVGKVKAQGITCIDGDIIADESIFDSYPIAPTWQWNDLGNYYASGAWGINVNENQYYVHFDKRGKIGAQPRIHSIHPKIPQLKLSNEIVVDSAHTGDQAYIFGGPYNYYKRVVGTIPQGDKIFTIKGSIPDPPLFLAYHVYDGLEKEKIKCKSYKSSFAKVAVRKDNKIMSLKSPILGEIVKKANFDSNNLYTEAILKMIGLKKRGQGSGQNGINILKRELKKSGVATDEQLIMDGSGLSARNKISSFALARFLAYLTKKADVEKLVEYIPRGGHTGTVRGMFGKSSARGNVWLKSGSMESVQSFTGYIKSKSGKWLSFSIIVNGFSAKNKVIRNKLDKLIRDIYFYC